MFPQKSDNKGYYDILGVSETATADELKKAYKKAAIKIHPDKGGDTEKFKELVEAYGFLSDPVKRISYDQCTCGEDAPHHKKRKKRKREEDAPPDAPRNGMSEGDIPQDPFPDHVSRLFFSLRKTRGDDLFAQLEVTLEDLYNGRSMNLAISRIVICLKCQGNGSKSGELHFCPICLGTAIKMSLETREVVQHGCLACRGTGLILSEEDKCDQCKGLRTVRCDNTLLAVNVKEGMQHGQTITVEGLADEWPDRQTGDVVVVLQLQEHPKFKRKGDDLFLEHTLTLTEALCGFQFQLTHLDKRRFLVSSFGHNIKNGQYAFIKDRGMPIYDPDFEPFMKGRLYIHFTVEFPETGSLTSLLQVRDLETILPPRPASELTYGELLECEDTELHYVSIDASEEKVARG